MKDRISRMENLKWWSFSRFGMFIHWGLYAMPARDEWERGRFEYKDEEYRKYFEFFEPDQFEPEEWARIAKFAGIRYVVVTAKHHDGFCLWDSRETDFTAAKAPLCRRDLLREILDAFRAEGIRTGVYYSLIDWNHENFVIDNYHPLRNAPDREELNKTRDQKKYAAYMRRQVRELLTKYGDIDVIWFDWSYPEKGRNEWESEKLISLVRELRPNILINDRCDLPGCEDFYSPEQVIPDHGLHNAAGESVPWEGCQTFSGAWCYARDEFSWKSELQCIEMLMRHVSRGGNLLLNVGPSARGVIDSRAVRNLNALGVWMKANSNAVYGCTSAPAEFPEPDGCRYTWNPGRNRLYLYVFSWPTSPILLPGIGEKLVYAQLLQDRSKINFEFAVKKKKPVYNYIPEGTAILKVPAVKPAGNIPVIELVLRS